MPHVCAGTALIKVCLAYEHGMLPSNLHYSQPNPDSESLNQGILKVCAHLWHAPAPE